MSVRFHWSQFRVKLQWLLDSADLIDRPELSMRLSVRLLTVNSEFTAFETSYQRILELADETITADREIVVAARADYTRALEAFDKLMTIKLQQSPPTSASTSENIKSDRMELDALLSHLPGLRLPSFDGDMDQWVGFNNLFDSLVDKRSDLSPAQKLAYLMSCLSGEPRGLVQHIRISDEGYSIARNLLMKRYQNTRRLADVQVDQILKLPVISIRLNGLRTQFLNPLIMAVNQLERLGFPVEEWSFLLLHICLSKLPTTLKSRFEQKFGCETDIIPKYSELVEFLETECRLLECASSESTHGLYNEYNARQTKPSRKAGHYAAVEVSPPCACCGETKHYVLNHCSQFKAMTPFARKDLVNLKRLCFFCLGPHSYRVCSRIPHCHCGSNKHHPMLCFNRSGTQQRRNINRNSTERSPPRMGGGGRYYNRTVRKSPRNSPTRTSPSSPHQRGEVERGGNSNGRNHGQHYDERNATREAVYTDSRGYSPGRR